ncbi:MAG TPA: hypothetical protein PLG47_06085, partial [Candidatus Dojkabacteria bacterium]|nr:hypothetical protein [Candidatus Dojkabacteria bacterium]
MNSFLQGNLGKSFGSMHDLWIKAITTNMGGTREQSSQRDIEGNKIDELRFSGFTDNQKVIKDYVDRRIIEYRLANKAEPTIDQKLEWRRVIENELSEKRSYDFESILKLYSLAVTQYKHKAMVEDAMTTAYNILRKTAEQQLTNAGEPKHDQFGRPIGKEGLSNMMGAVDYFMKGYYGQPTSLQEMPFGDKIYTSEEKKIKEDVEKLLEENQQKLESGEVKIEDYIKNKEKLEGQLVGLGGRKTVSAIGDQVNMWIRLRGLGWNLFAPIMNMNVGFFTNLTEASGGIRFNQEQLMRGYALALIKDTKKVSNIMRRYDTLKEIQNEAYATQSVARGWKKWLSPFYTTNRAEYVNQSPVMVAVLLNTKVIVDGKEMNLYDAHDENGNLPENIEYVSKIPVVTSLKDIGVKIV